MTERRDLPDRLAELRASTEGVDLDQLLAIIRELGYKTSFYRDRRGRTWRRVTRLGSPHFTIPAGQPRLPRSTVNPILRLLEEVSRRDDE
jgi:hypothetical protein